MRSSCFLPRRPRGFLHAAAHPVQTIGWPAGRRGTGRRPGRPGVVPGCRRTGRLRTSRGRPILLGKHRSAGCCGYPPPKVTHIRRRRDPLVKEQGFIQPQASTFPTRSRSASNRDSPTGSPPWKPYASHNPAPPPLPTPSAPGRLPVSSPTEPPAWSTEPASGLSKGPAPYQSSFPSLSNLCHSLIAHSICSSAMSSNSSLV